MRRVLGFIVLGLAGCGAGGSISVPTPQAFTPASVADARAWAAGTLPADAREIRFRWQFRDDQGAAGGRGRVRLALPDSARLDVAGPLGSGRAAAFVSGDTALWAQPEKDIKKLVPNYPLFWALLGIVRTPDDPSEVGSFTDPSTVGWRFVQGTDTVDYVRVGGSPPRLYAEVRESGKIVGTVETRFAPDGQPASARLVVPSAPARLDLTFYSNLKAKPFAPDTWTPPEP
jgi:hypothetical protein